MNFLSLLLGLTSEASSHKNKLKRLKKIVCCTTLNAAIFEIREKSFSKMCAKRKEINQA